MIKELETLPGLSDLANQVIFWDYKDHSFKRGHHHEQAVVRFKNGFGASVIQGDFTYGGLEGKFEMAVIVFENEDNDSWTLTYETPITKDVIGHLTTRDATEYLIKIAALPHDPDGFKKAKDKADEIRSGMKALIADSEDKEKS